MPGFDFNRFEDLSDKEKKYFNCSLCSKIFDNAVNSDCGHDFCKDCIEEWIQNNRNECPECHHSFRRKRSIELSNDNNLVIIANNVFTRNLGLNSMINESTIKCDFDLNGCQQTMKLSSLQTHLIECEHRICKKCELTLNTSEDHNCLELLKKERNRLSHELSETKDKNFGLENELKETLDQKNDFKEKLNKCNERNGELLSQNLKLELEVKSLNEINTKFKVLKIKISRLEDQIKSHSNYKNEVKNKFKEIKDKNQLLEEKVKKYKNSIKELNEKLEKSQEMDRDLNNSNQSEEEITNKKLLNDSDDWLLSSSLKVDYILLGTFKLVPRSIVLNESYLFASSGEGCFSISYADIEKFMYCLEPSLPFLIIEVNKPSSYDIRDRFRFRKRTKGWFDVESEDSSEKYVIIKLLPKSLDLMIELLVIRFSKYKQQLKLTLIDNHLTETMVKSARRLLKEN